MGLDQYVYKKELDGNEYNEDMYWRKNNQLQGWFEVNTGLDNCEQMHLTAEMITKLLDDIGGTLPKTGGFFYGDYKMDQIEESDLSKYFTEVLGEINSGAQYYYTCWY